MLMIVFKMILWTAPGPPDGGGRQLGGLRRHLADTPSDSRPPSACSRCFLPRDQFTSWCSGGAGITRRPARPRWPIPTPRPEPQFGRVARPAAVDGRTVRALPDAAIDQITDTRMKIAEALSEPATRRPTCTRNCWRSIPGRCSASPSSSKSPTSSARTACPRPSPPTRSISTYTGSPEADSVRLLLGIIYARDLQQYEVAEGHLRHSVMSLTDEGRREQARHWLRIASKELGHPDEPSPT